MPDFSIENSLSSNKNKIICGIDEVGRGPLAGPVLASAVIIPNNNKIKYIENEINDSKKISAKKRAYLYAEIKKIAKIAIGKASVQEIDNINILQATMLAMQRAFNNLCTIYNIIPDIALIDGNKTPNLKCQTQTVIKGDQISLSIAAASIIAKCERDKIMAKLAKAYPNYGWEKNAGYGTKAHMLGIEKFGVTKHHRTSFAPVFKALHK